MYMALRDGENLMLIGPPEGLVDSLNLPEPFATNLHNVLFRRRIFTFTEASRGTALNGALQEALTLDAQRLTEAFLKFEKQEA
jgi:hypothetical protein